MADKAKPGGKPGEKGKPDGKPKLSKSGEHEIQKPKPKPFRIQAHVIDVKGITPQPGILPDLVATVTVSGYSTKYTQVVRQTCEASFGAFFEWKTELDFEEFHAAPLPCPKQARQFLVSARANSPAGRLGLAGGLGSLRLLDLAPRAASGEAAPCCFQRRRRSSSACSMQTRRPSRRYSACTT
jgi:hypothetical protein